VRCTCVCASVSEYDRSTLYPEELGLLCERKKGGEGVGLFKANTVDKVDAGGKETEQHLGKQSNT
jgi:hypothetical protein